MGRREPEPSGTANGLGRIEAPPLDQRAPAYPVLLARLQEAFLAECA